MLAAIFLTMFTGSTAVAPASATLALTATSPTIGYTAPSFSIAPAAATLALTVTSPTVSFAPAGTVAPAGVTLTLLSTSPTISAVAPTFAVAPASVVMALAAASPTITFTPAAVGIAPASAKLALSSTSPTISFTAAAYSVSPANAALALTSTQPALAYADPIDPTAANPAYLRLVFPAFAGVPDAVIAFWLTRAARVVDASWPDGDRVFAQMLLAAHLMTEQGIGTGADAAAAAQGASGFKVMRSGSLTLERFEPGSAAGYSGTAYGRQFALLLRQVRGGPRVTGTGCIVGSPGMDGVFGYGRLPRW